MLTHAKAQLPTKATLKVGGITRKFIACTGNQKTQLVLNVGINFRLHSSRTSCLFSIKLIAEKQIAIFNIVTKTSGCSVFFAAIELTNVKQS